MTIAHPLHASTAIERLDQERNFALRESLSMLVHDAPRVVVIEFLMKSVLRQARIAGGGSTIPRQSCAVTNDDGWRCVVPVSEGHQHYFLSETDPLVLGRAR